MSERTAPLSSKVPVARVVSRKEALSVLSTDNLSGTGTVQRGSPRGLLSSQTLPGHWKRLSQGTAS